MTSDAKITHPNHICKPFLEKKRKNGKKFTLTPARTPNPSSLPHAGKPTNRLSAPFFRTKHAIWLLNFPFFSARYAFFKNNYSFSKKLFPFSIGYDALLRSRHFF